MINMQSYHIPLPVKVFRSSNSYHTVAVCELGKDTNVIVILELTTYGGG